MRESGLPGRYGITRRVDNYSSGSPPARTTACPVYVTVSAARSPQEEGDGPARQPAAADRTARATRSGCARAPATPALRRAFRVPAYIFVNGVLTPVDNRALVLTFTDDTDRAARLRLGGRRRRRTRARPAPEGDRVVVVQHTRHLRRPRLRRRRRAQRRGHGARQRHAGRLRHEVEPGTTRGPPHGRGRGTTFADLGRVYTGLDDELLVELAKAVPPGTRSSSSSCLDADSERRSCSSRSTSTRASTRRPDDHVRRSRLERPGPDRRGARHDFKPRGPADGGVEFRRGAATTDPSYVFPNLRSARPARHRGLDDDTPGVVRSRAAATRRRAAAAPATTTRSASRSGRRRRQRRVLTDGTTDVVAITACRHARGDRRLPPVAAVPRQPDVAGATLTRGATAATSAASWTRASPPASSSASVGGPPHDPYSSSRSPRTAITLTAASPAPPARSPTRPSAGSPASGPVGGRRQLRRRATRRIGAATAPGWLADGFLEGQRVRVCTTAGPALRRLQDRADPRRQRDEGREDRVHERGRLPVRPAPRPSASPGSPRQPPSRTSNWYEQQTVELAADPVLPGAAGPRGRQGLPGLDAPALEAARPARGRGRRRPAPTARSRTASSCRARRTARSSRSPPQPPESSAIDVLNVFNDSSQEDRRGTMTSTTLSGFGMAERPDLRRLEPVRRAGDVPGRDQLRDDRLRRRPVPDRRREEHDRGRSTCCSAPATTRSTSRARSTRRAGTDVHAGHARRGDRLALVGRDSAADGTVTRHGVSGTGPPAGCVVGRRLCTVSAAAARRHGRGVAGVGRFTRRSGGPSRALAAVDRAGAVSAAARAAASGADEVYVAGPHGGLTVVHGGGNMRSESRAC